MSVADKIQLIKRNIEGAAKNAGRSVDEIKLIAVSKTRNVTELQQAIDAGLNVFGENTVQDAMTKIPVLGTEKNEWHFIGHLQSKKVKFIPNNFRWIHTIDSIQLAKKLSDAMVMAGVKKDLNCLMQVNVTGESTKSGVPVLTLNAFIDELLSMDFPCLRWRGMMTIGVKDDSEKTRDGFIRLRESLDLHKKKFNPDDFDQLSMGMSEDYPIAIEEGATMIRLGTSIFGNR